MDYTLVFTESYNKRVFQFLKKHPEILPLYKKTLIPLELNPFHPSLRLHKPDGKHKDLHSVSINMQYRITIEFFIHDGKIIPVNVGDHDIYK